MSLHQRMKTSQIRNNSLKQLEIKSNEHDGVFRSTERYNDSQPLSTLLLNRPGKPFSKFLNNCLDLEMLVKKSNTPFWADWKINLDEYLENHTESKTNQDDNLLYGNPHYLNKHIFDLISPELTNHIIDMTVKKLNKGVNDDDLIKYNFDFLKK